MMKMSILSGAVLLGLAISSPAQGGVLRSAHDARLRAPAKAHAADKYSRRAEPQRAPRHERGQRHQRHQHHQRHVVRKPHYRMERVWVRGRIERVYCPAVYEYRRGLFGIRYRVCVRPAHYDTIEHPGHWEYRRVLVTGSMAPH